MTTVDVYECRMFEEDPPVCAFALCFFFFVALPSMLLTQVGHRSKAPPREEDKTLLIFDILAVAFA